jgi:hypothetical protein
MLQNGKDSSIFCSDVHPIPGKILTNNKCSLSISYIIKGNAQEFQGFIWICLASVAGFCLSGVANCSVYSSASWVPNIEILKFTFKHS